ncbi:MAG: ABC transporter permease [Bacteroidales bacterium]|nr:ABC transporter permease [Bacteroidales bacterium]
MHLTKIWNRIKEAVRDLAYIWAEEMKMCIKDEGVLIFFILVPLAYPLLYSWIYNNEVVRDVPVAVVDLSHSAESREYIRLFNASADTRVAYYCNNMAEAKDLMGRQKVNGVLHFPADFALKLNRGEQTSVGVYCDMSLMLTYKAIYMTSMNVASAINAGIQIEGSSITATTERDEEVTTKPLDFEEVPIFNSTEGYGNSILPGVLIIIIQQTLLLGIGLSAGTAREKNRYKSLVSLRTHKNGLFRIVGGKALCYLMVYSVMTAYLVLLVPKFFGFTTIASGSDLIGLLFPFLLACIFFGMFVSCLIRYRENVMLIVVFTSVPFLFLTGISWPVASIPGFWQGVSWLFPSTFGVRGFLTLSSMGGVLADVKVPYIALWIQTAVYFLATCIVYQVQIKRAAADGEDGMAA